MNHERIEHQLDEIISILRNDFTKEDKILRKLFQDIQAAKQRIPHPQNQSTSTKE